MSTLSTMSDREKVGAGTGGEGGGGGSSPVQVPPPTRKRYSSSFGHRYVGSGGSGAGGVGAAGTGAGTGGTATTGGATGGGPRPGTPDVTGGGKPVSHQLLPLFNSTPNFYLIDVLAYKS